MNSAHFVQDKVIAIIPARYGSTRLDGKPLLDIAGKPMVEWVYERAKKAKLINDVIVATDDKRIFDAVKGFHGKAVMTSASHKSGMDRLAEAAANIKCDIVVNVQGDEPLIESEMIDEAIRPMVDDSEVYMATLKTKILDAEELNSPNVVKVVTDRNNFALYFSRLPIPYHRDEWKDPKHLTIHGSRFTVFKHIGLYVYRKDFLLKFARMKPTLLEEAEKLEQLRVLENGYKIKVVETKYNSIGVDTKEDLEKVRKIVKESR
ncbi:MAG: 3-deoxy-manno-octulosonate cytidylyltransferase [Deltaproteobacteria bacterium RIFCSPLOWO2_12_FULL_43_16]|nr:MAG: 3-deoxy-manno-octulosonate cytidylyltransferase [Deltaproteobacteria bacterium GWA2_43_19]OGQ09356.1 MAG: 3-deoxy-manno-octulosonate cytidylyltransferase [Deltaproteobacteria bacterium RIFCSPHIGHO2_02_FULL_43_33]OGQ58585.1 MAG: 3-deoxy-manno-octulosonate cytidylyltransferase [Deltaproteobacteria bacterium RIFCSPLOWO2_12_FULL_43_16]